MKENNMDIHNYYMAITDIHTENMNQYIDLWKELVKISEPKSGFINSIFPQKKKEEKALIIFKLCIRLSLIEKTFTFAEYEVFKLGIEKVVFRDKDGKEMFVEIERLKENLFEKYKENTTIIYEKILNHLRDI